MFIYFGLISVEILIVKITFILKLLKIEAKVTLFSNLFMYKSYNHKKTIRC